jgi:putative RNA 2'-phosphotransferase
MSERLVELSKAVSHALRHEPWRYELEFDHAGWADLDALVAGLAREPRWHRLTRADLLEMVGRSRRRRHEIEGGRIRALYGHSLPGRIEKRLGVPPDPLFHGTRADRSGLILVDGLHPTGRQYVHLSIDRASAIVVGLRKSDQVVVLAISTRAAYACGVRFLVGNETVWLADHVPPRFIRVDKVLGSLPRSSI